MGIFYSDNQDRMTLTMIQNPDYSLLSLSVCPRLFSAKHDKFTGTGHAGFLRCLLSTKRKYYIYDLANKLKSYIDRCGLCLKLRNPKKNTVNVPLHPAAARPCTVPRQRFQIDHCGSFSSHKYSYKQIIFITDEFFQFTCLVPVDTTDAGETFYCINCLLRIHGIPYRGLSSDRDSAFISKIMTLVAKIHGIKWSHDLTSNPCSTGLMERKVQKCKTLLKYVTLKNPDIDIFYSLIDVQFAVKYTISTVFGFTSHHALYGFEIVDPIDYSVRLDDNLVSSPIRFADELKCEIGRRNDLIKWSR